MSGYRIFIGKIGPVIFPCGIVDITRKFVSEQFNRRVVRKARIFKHADIIKRFDAQRIRIDDFLCRRFQIRDFQGIRRLRRITALCGIGRNIRMTLYNGIIRHAVRKIEKTAAVACSRIDRKRSFKCIHRRSHGIPFEIFAFIQTRRRISKLRRKRRLQRICKFIVEAGNRRN